MIRPKRQTILLPQLKPRAKALHEALHSRTSGRQSSPFDFNRAREKQNLFESLKPDDTES